MSGQKCHLALGIAKGGGVPGDLMYVVNFSEGPQQKAFAGQRVLGTAVLVLSFDRRWTWLLISVEGTCQQYGRGQ